MSSNVGTNHIPWDKVGMIYMGSQKNLGTSGCTIMVIREDLFGHAEKDCPILCDWLEFEKSPDTYYNTPAIFPMYVTMLNVKHMNNQGGINHYIQLANKRSKMLWDTINSSEDYYKSKITDKQYESRLNCVFRIQNGNLDLEDRFIKEAKKAGIIQIKAHYFNPGIRISMYNAMPMEGVEYLVKFMAHFKAKYPW